MCQEILKIIKNTSMQKYKKKIENTKIENSWVLKLD